MKYQKGFASLISIILIVLGISVAGGGYVIYKDKQQQKKNEANIQKLQDQRVSNNNNSSNTNVFSTTPQPIVSTSPSTEVAKNTTTNTSVSINTATKLNCDDNWQCLISAASQCQPASGTVSYNNVPNPLIPGLLNSGKTNYDIKKSGNSCTVVFSMISASLAFSAEGRSKALAEGSTNTEIDARLKIMNDSFKNVIGLPTTCTASGNIIASYLTDAKSGNTGSGEFRLSADFSNSSSQSTVTTSSGQKLTCSTQQPSTKITTYSTDTAPSVSLSSDTYGYVAKGTAVTITLDTKNVGWCDAPGSLFGRVSGSTTFYPTETTTYTALCYDKQPTGNYTQPTIQTSLTIKVSQ